MPNRPHNPSVVDVSGDDMVSTEVANPEVHAEAQITS